MKTPKTPITLCWLCLLISISSACSDKKKEALKEEESISAVLPDMKNEVTVMPLTSSIFNHELVSNGKVTARGQADLRFGTSEVITHIYVKNGDRVRKGQKLAELNLSRLSNKQAQAKDALERSKLDLKDVLIGQGHATDDFSKIPEETMKLASVKSGYEQSRIQYEQIKLDVQQATLTAPFDGVVANLFAKPYNMSNPSETFCTVVDTQGMEADFSVLESELPLIKQGDRVLIAPYADASSKYEGRVAEINPLVDTNGMVKVKARVEGKGKLFSGMNVRISVRRSLGKQLVIPKTAVVLRSGKQVVFTLTKEGKARWNYVQTGFESADSCVVSNREEPGVSDGLATGDIVIVTGNVNLADEAPVTIIK